MQSKSEDTAATLGAQEISNSYGTREYGAAMAFARANIPIYNKDWGSWVTAGGTSASAPLIAGIYGMAGNASTAPLGYAYTHRRDPFDITAAPTPCSCHPGRPAETTACAVARKGHDAPTGLVLE